MIYKPVELYSKYIKTYNRQTKIQIDSRNNDHEIIIILITFNTRNNNRNNYVSLPILLYCYYQYTPNTIILIQVRNDKFSLASFIILNKGLFLNNIWDKL